MATSLRTGKNGFTETTMILKIYINKAGFTIYFLFSIWPLLPCLLESGCIQEELGHNPVGTRRKPSTQPEMIPMKPCN